MPYKDRVRNRAYQRDWSKTRRNKGGRAKNSSACRKYVSQYLKTHPCVDCGEPDPIVLDFDHVRGIKLGEVSRMSYDGKHLRRVILEIEKCEIRCANCHRRITHKRGQYHKKKKMEESLTVGTALEPPQMPLWY